MDDERTPITGTQALLRAVAQSIGETEARLRDAIRVFRDLHEDIAQLRFVLALIFVLAAIHVVVEMVYVLRH